MNKSDRQKFTKYLEKQISYFEEEYIHRKSQPSRCAHELLKILQTGCFEIADFLYHSDVITYDEWEAYCDRILLNKMLDEPIKCCNTKCEAITEEGFCKFDLRSDELCQNQN